MVGGFSRHAGVTAEAQESESLERLCRHIARPAIREKRQSMSPWGRVRFQLKTPWRGGAKYAECDAVDLMAHIPAGDLRSSESAIPTMCHCQAGGVGFAAVHPPGPVPRSVPPSAEPRAVAGMVLVCIALFLLKVLGRLPVQPIQYGFAGAALAIVFLLLLAPSEHIGFAPAWLLAALACKASTSPPCCGGRRVVGRPV